MIHSIASNSGTVKVTLLHIEECPNWEQTGAQLRAELDATGHSNEPVEFVLLNAAEDASRYPFAGSPTILIDGVDLFPGAEVTTGLSCRIYRTDTGFAGTPTREQIAEALRTLG